MFTRTASTFAPPVMEARRWLEGVSHPADRPLLNVSQAAPVDPPPPAMLAALSEIVLNDSEAHLYGPVLGLPALRAEVASQWSASYGGTITADNVAITSGCNQAFAAAIASLCSEDDEVIIPAPYYFNHVMWLDMLGVKTVPLAPGQGLIPDVALAETLITQRTRAIALVSPNNPGGVEYPAATLTAFRDLARRHGIALIVDETYRDFDSRQAPPHQLCQQSDWEKTLIQLYSFSKSYRLTGTVTICPNQIGQRAALWGMQNLGEWLAGERLEILDRRAAIEEGFPTLSAQGWELLGCGAYFAYLKHPFDERSDDLAQRLVRDASVLTLPGTMFMPDSLGGGTDQLRIAFANIDRSGIHELFNRLARLTP